VALGPMSAAPANTYMEPTAVGVKEDLADVIYRIDPDETPLVSAISNEPAQQVLTEWVVQELGVAADNAQPEGFTASAQAITKPIRLNNICQIMARTVGVSNTTRAADFVGGQDEYNRQIVLKGMEVKRDLELAITSPLVRTITDPRHMSGLPTYCSLGSRGAGAGVMPVGDGSNAGTAGTLRDLTLAMVNSAVQQSWNAGGKPTLGIMSGNIKDYFATLTTAVGAPIAIENIYNASPRGEITMVGAVDIYRTNFGTIQLAPDRFCPAHQILLVTPEFVELAPLSGRDMVQEDYARTGDNQQGGVVFEGCVRPTAPKANAVIMDLNQ
jgi:Family of unknown function (DUF5309)